MPAADSRAAKTGAYGQVAALLARDPATHVVLDSPPSVAEEYLHEKW